MPSFEQVFIHDPLYNWALTAAAVRKRQRDDSPDETGPVTPAGTPAVLGEHNTAAGPAVGNADAERTLLRVQAKLEGTESGACLKTLLTETTTAMAFHMNVLPSTSSRVHWVEALEYTFKRETGQLVHLRVTRACCAQVKAQLAAWRVRSSSCCKTRRTQPTWAACMSAGHRGSEPIFGPLLCEHGSAPQDAHPASRRDISVSVTGVSCSAHGVWCHFKSSKGHGPGVPPKYGRRVAQISVDVPSSNRISNSNICNMRHEALHKPGGQDALNPAAPSIRLGCELHRVELHDS